MSDTAPSPAAAPTPTAAEPVPATAATPEGTPENPGIRIRPIPPKRERITFDPADNPKVSPDGDAIPEGYKPRLPGVFEADQGADLIPSVKKRDPQTGRFVKGAVEGQAEGQVEGDEPPPAEPAKPDLPGGEPPKPAKVKFLGKEYEGLEKVEQIHRTLQGEFRKQQDERRKLVEDRDYGYNAAHAWEKEANYWREVAEGKQKAPTGQPAAQHTAQPAGQPVEDGLDFDVDAVVGGIDMNAFEMIAAHPKGGLPQAGRYLVAETLAALKKSLVPAIMAQVQKQLQPVVAVEDARAAHATQLQSFELVASMRTADGEVAFPELGDAAAVEAVGELYGRVKGKNFQTAQDIIEGIALYRLMQGLSRQPAQPGVDDGMIPEVPQPAPGAAASLEAEPQGTLPPNGGRAQGSPATRRLIAALDKPDLVDPVLGFRRNG